MTWTIRAWAVAALMALAVTASAENAADTARAEPALSCAETEFDGLAFSYCRIDPAQADIRLFLYDASGEPWAQFSRLGAALEADNQRLVVAMNAGMYHPDRAPVGHYVENGVTARSVIRGASPGNFGLVPNGVLCLQPGRARVMETERFVAEAPACDHATQSGPMLVIDGALHPRFLPDSTSRYIRNGVGTNASGTQMVIAISDEPVTFHEFGRFFRESLQLEQALFLDGNISRLHAPALGRSDAGWAMGPILGVIQPLSPSGDDSADPAG